MASTWRQHASHNPASHLFDNPAMMLLSLNILRKRVLRTHVLPLNADQKKKKKRKIIIIKSAEVLDRPASPHFHRHPLCLRLQLVGQLYHGPLYLSWSASELSVCVRLNGPLKCPPMSAAVGEVGPSRAARRALGGGDTGPLCEIRRGTPNLCAHTAHLLEDGGFALVGLEVTVVAYLPCDARVFLWFQWACQSGATTPR